MAGMALGDNITKMTDGILGERISHWGDILVIILYFSIVLAVGMWTLCRPNRGSVSGYFLAGRDMGWFPVGASMFASNIGSEHFVGLAGTGAAAGIAIVVYEWMSLPLVALLAWLFLPVYISAGVYTLPEYVQKRFGGQRLRVYLSGLSLLLYVITKIAVSIYAGALFIQMSLGWDMYLSIITLLIITGLYTVLGGLAAVMYTDAVQTAIMTIGAIILAAVGFKEIGGYNNLEYKYVHAVPSIRDENTTCGIPGDDSFNLFRHPLYGDNPWPGLLLQASIGCLWYWCADQVIVQRALAAKNVTHAKGGAILAGYLKLFPLWLMVMPGMISRALYPDEVGCVDPDECLKHCNNAAGCSNIAYPLLVMTLLPVGLRGLLLAVMLSAIMSSLTSIFNSASTLFTMDMWTKMRPQAHQRELLIVGRLTIVALCVVSVLWVPLVQSSAGGQLFIYIQAIQGYLGTPIGALFLMAVFWKRTTEQGAFWGVLAGHLCGIIRMILEFVYPEPPCGEEDTRPHIVSKLHYTYFSQLNLVLTFSIITVISIVTKKMPDEDNLAGVTWWTRRVPRDEKTELTEANNLAPEKEECLKTNTDEIEEPTEHNTSFFRRWFNFLCGIPEVENAHNTETYDERMARLDEKSRWRTVINVNLVIALTFLAFLMGFYH